MSPLDAIYRALGTVGTGAGELSVLDSQLDQLILDRYEPRVASDDE